MTTVTVGELEANLRAVLERVRAGESVVVESEGAPAVQISPCDPFAALEAAFPGIRRATKPALALLSIRPVRLNGPVDAVELIRYERGDR